MDERHFRHRRQGSSRPQSTARKYPSASPKTVKLGIIITAILVVGMIVAQWMMQTYLDTSKAFREAAYKKVVDNHPLKYRDLIESYAAQNNLEPAFVAAIIMAESSFRPGEVSSVGARGLMQIMPDTAQWIAGKLGEGEGFSFENMFDPETNIRYGTWYLSYLADKFAGDPVLVAGAYHAGQGTIQNWVNSGESDIASFREGPTKDYARKVTTSYGIYQRLYFDENA